MHFSKSDGRMRIVMIRLSMWHHDDNSEVEMVLLITIRSEIFDFTQNFLKNAQTFLKSRRKFADHHFNLLQKNSSLHFFENDVSLQKKKHLPAICAVFTFIYIYNNKTSLNCIFTYVIIN